MLKYKDSLANSKKVKEENKIQNDSQSQSSAADYFGRVAKDYSMYRDLYPEEMIANIINKCEERSLAVDCCTGTGQLTEDLCHYFDRVIGLDKSVEQLNQAHKEDNIKYYVVDDAAEILGLPDNSVDLITVGTALAWLDREKFLRNARRVLKKGGVLACADQTIPVIEDNPALLSHFACKNIAPNGPQTQNDGVKDIETPNGFVRLNMPMSYEMKSEKEIKDIIGWVRTTSGFAVAQKNGVGDAMLKDLESDLIATKKKNFHVKTEVVMKAFKKIY